MGYKKILVDNPICSRRFHVTFDPDEPAVPTVELKCQHCGVVVYERQNHPKAVLAREENLVKTAELSDDLVRSCNFRDQFSAGEDSPPIYEKR